MYYLDRVCEEMVSPPKFRYNSYDLGQSVLSNGRRHDFEIRRDKSSRIKCSIYIPKHMHPSNICILYLHSMNGSRLECITYADSILNMGLTFCCFDFQGCGLSTGNTISFGANEKFDVNEVLLEVMTQFEIYRFVVWGRSMGAVAAIKYAQIYCLRVSAFPEIVGIILDSPFYSLKQLILELGQSRMNLPQILIAAGYHMIKGTLQEKGHFKVSELELSEPIRKINSEVPILFLASKEDATVRSYHSEKLYHSCNSSHKRLVYFQGLHHESRDKQYMESIESFLYDQLQKKNDWVSTSNARLRKMEILKRSEYLQAHQEMKADALNSDCTCSLFTQH